MIPRYADSRITQIFSDEAKLGRWQKVELAVIEARVKLGLVSEDVYRAIADTLLGMPFDVAWWLQRDKEIHHDLNAFIEERSRHLSAELTSEFHRDMTSYDTEDPAFALALIAAAEIIENDLAELLFLIGGIADAHRHTVMLKRTHGQGAKLGSFGSRVLTWYAMLDDLCDPLNACVKRCSRSRISGAVGNYGGNMTPEIERASLKVLDLEPFYGATQIMPRSVFVPLAQNIQLVVESLGKIALDIRLMARSGLPLVHEPFAKVQKGSSAMPHKKNPIRTEQIGGLVMLARGQVLSITETIGTWEERAIEQSCVERVAWPDLFHTALRAISVMKQVLSGLVVYPRNMLEEIVQSRGTYASDEAKNFLAAELAKKGIPAEDAYRVVQLASFNAFASMTDGEFRGPLTQGYEYADDVVLGIRSLHSGTTDGISSRIAEGWLFAVPSLKATEEDVARWNACLKEIFTDAETTRRWVEVFTPTYLLRNEAALFERII
jgi:adenylosuccinate lyase